MKYALAGNREISVKILGFLMGKGYNPSYLFVSNTQDATFGEELIKISGLSSEFIFIGNEINSYKCTKILEKVGLDYIFGIHFPYIISEKILKLPRVGVINLHPSYLPYNKGWHTPSWAILDKTPFGATLHFMTKKLDKGDIISQVEVKIEDDDTANSIYNKVLKEEFLLFKKTFDNLLSLKPNRIRQTKIGTTHLKSDIKKIQKIDLNESVQIGDFIDRLRALTTNNIAESCYYIKNGKRYYIQVVIQKEK